MINLEKTPPNRNCKIIFVSHGCSMVLFKNLQRFRAESRIQALKKFYEDWEGELKVVKGHV